MMTLMSLALICWPRASTCRSTITLYYYSLLLLFTTYTYTKERDQRHFDVSGADLLAARQHVQKYYYSLLLLFTTTLYYLHLY